MCSIETQSECQSLLKNSGQTSGLEVCWLQVACQPKQGWSLGSRELGLVRGRGQVGCQGSEDRGVVRNELGQYQARWMSRDRSESVKVPGKPEQRLVRGGRSGVRPDTVG